MKNMSTNGITASEESNAMDDHKVIQYVNIKLAALEQPIYGNKADSQFIDIVQPLLKNHQQKNRLLLNYFCPADQRIQEFINDYLKGVVQPNSIKLPKNTFILDTPGLARTLSLPPNNDKFVSDIVSSYRIKQGVLHNPKHDRRTTYRSFHVVEGGLPIPEDKITVPKNVFANILKIAVNPPNELLQIPFTAAQKEHAELFVSLLMRPVVCPEAGEFTKKRTMETRFFAPGNLVSNLDFVESIFGNGGDPYLSENDAGLDTEHWTGTTGCVILAPHLIYASKKELGLPPFKSATEKQKREGMCWKSTDEKYNEGNAFKVTCRDERGVILTVIADNYFGYSKKEIKTQISFSSNLIGLSEEEHSGGAIAFPSYDLGEEFILDNSLTNSNKTFKDVTSTFKSLMDIRPEGYGVDLKYPNILYVPEDSKFNLRDQSITWMQQGKKRKIKLLANQSYVLPTGYKIHMEKLFAGHDWRLIGTIGDGTLCHKPCTVSGGGKSEISKSISDAMIQGPVFVSDFHKDMDFVEVILKRDYGNRFNKQKKGTKKPSRPILSSERSLGSVIKLFTPASDYTDEYNAWLESLPHHIRDIIFVIKRFYKPEWGDNWRAHFGVDTINDAHGHELKYEDIKLKAKYLRVGHETDGSQRIYKLRQDYTPAQKVQVEDDITASVVVPKESLKHLNPEYKNKSVKIVFNCESKLFQRPDDAIYRGYDKQAESDLTSPNTFLSNYEPLNQKDANQIVEDAVNFEHYTEPVQSLIRGFIKERTTNYFASPSHPRLVNGKRSKNPRYLQNRLDLVKHRDKYLSFAGTRLHRWIPPHDPVHFPVNAVLAGRRNNPPDAKLGIPPLAVYNPIHYQELPELFMDFICSVTGKSPSTTGFGSEGALTKGPFNALWPIVDLNNALVSYILTGYDGFTSAAGYTGPKVRVDHDISLLIPEIWCRMSVEEREPAFLIKHGYLEKVSDFEHKGQKVRASLLGYRITTKFVNSFLGRIFNKPNVVFSPAMLQPEKQDLNVFAEGMKAIVDTQVRVSKYYFADGCIEGACPPLKALIHIMAEGKYKGKGINHPEIRGLFSRANLLKSDWYQERLLTQQKRQTALWSRHIQYLEEFMVKEGQSDKIDIASFEERLKNAKENLKQVKSQAYLKKIKGSIGADPFHKQTKVRSSKSTEKTTVSA